MVVLGGMAWAWPGIAQPLPEPASPVPLAQSSDLPQLVPAPQSDRLQYTAPLPTPPPAAPAPFSSSSPSDPRFPTVQSGDRRSPLPRSSVFPYILGPGDIISIDIFDVPEFSDVDYLIAVDGTINMPWIDSVYLEGLTLDGASDYLEDLYSPLIREPVIVVSLIQSRPLRISVVGEVTRPGSYTLDPAGGPTGDLGDGVSQWTTAIQAIQQAGGVTQLADLRQIEIRRGQTLPGEESTIEINLWEFLQTGSLAQDITLRDGDTVVVPTVTALNPEELGETAVANFSPQIINTYVIGEVENPGVLELPPNASLNQALLAAGGYANDRAGRVELIRVNLDGSVERRRVSVDFADPVNEDTNPPLRNNDIVFVRRSTLAGVVDVLDFVLNPIRNLFGTFDGVLDVIDRLDPDDNAVDDEDEEDENNNGIPDDDERRFGTGDEDLLDGEDTFNPLF